MNKPADFSRSLELVHVGDAVGVVLPVELLERLGLTLGDRLTVAETSHGFTVEPEGRGVDVQMKIAREVMGKRRRALAELAK